MSAGSSWRLRSIVGPERFQHWNERYSLKVVPAAGAFVILLERSEEVQAMAKIVLTVEIESGGETIGDKENVAAALERFGRVRILKVEEKPKSFWDDYMQGTAFQGKISGF